MGIEIYCSCGKDLSDNVCTDRDGIEIEACPDCIKVAHKEGYEDGYTEGCDDRISK